MCVLVWMCVGVCVDECVEMRTRCLCDGNDMFLVVSHSLKDLSAACCCLRQGVTDVPCAWSPHRVRPERPVATVLFLLVRVAGWLPADSCALRPCVGVVFVCVAEAERNATASSPSQCI